MDGDLVLSWSKPGVGSCFVATMVLHAGVSKPAEQPEPEAERKAPPRVLVVDDNLVNLQVATMLCQRLGVHPISTDDGTSAIEILRQIQVDLVLMDIHMPGTDGITATNLIRALTDSVTPATVPVVALSADQLPQTRRRSFSAGINAYHSKPLTLDHLRDILARYGLIRTSALAGGKVLVVDDSPVNRAVLVQFLEVRGFDVVAVEDGSTALAWTSREAFSMIFVDLYMPGIDGLATIKRIRAQGSHEDRPIVVCTGETSEQVQLATLNAGATGILLKPIRASALDELLARPAT